MERLSQKLERLIGRFAVELVDQSNRHVVVPPMGSGEGYWFGGGNVVEGKDGRVYLSGRYRNPGDSRHGVGKGARGLELALFVSDDGGSSFGKLLSFSKADLAVPDGEVVSIEGSALLVREDRVELFVSTEKTDRAYPQELRSFQKPGTGVWSIDMLSAPTVEGLKGAKIERLIASDIPSHLHVKDPVVSQRANGDTDLFFCTHPFTWASSNAGLAVRPAGSAEFGAPRFDLMRRGDCWDIAITRLTGLFDLPRVGAFREGPTVTIAFYDGGECIRNHEQHAAAVRRARGYSCEEIGGLAYVLDHDFDHIHRLSETSPLFVSPWGTGASRYMTAFVRPDRIRAFWEQSQADRSQPLVSSEMSRERLEQLLAEG